MSLGQAEGAPVVRGSSLGVIGQAWHLLLAFGLYAYLARTLGPASFGMWTVVLTVLAWFEIVTISGAVKVATRVMSADPSAVPSMSRGTYIAQLIAGVAVAAVMIVAAGPIASWLGDATLAPLIRLAALDAPFYALFMAASAIVLSTGRFSRQAAAWMVYASAKALLVAGLVWAGLGIQGALVGNALSSAVGLVAMFVGLPPRREKIDWGVVRNLGIGSGVFLALALVQGLSEHVDLWIVSSKVADARSVGFFASATVLAEIPVFLFLGLNRVIFPSVSTATAGGDGSAVDAYTRGSLRAAVIVSVLAAAIVAGGTLQVIDIVYSKAFAPAALALVLLMLAGAGRTVNATCAEILMARGRSSAALTFFGIALVAEVVAVALATPRWGFTGGAAGAAISMVAGAAMGVAALGNANAVRVLATCARALLAGGVVVALLRAWSPAPVLFVVALPFLAAFYLGLLWLAREFDDDDIAHVRAALRGAPRV